MPRRNFVFHMARIFVDKELNLPIRYESYDWPKEPGGPPELMEEYTYLNLKLNNGFTDADFDIEESELQVSLMQCVIERSFNDLAPRNTAREVVALLRQRWIGPMGRIGLIRPIRPISPVSPIIEISYTANAPLLFCRQEWDLPAPSGCFYPPDLVLLLVEVFLKRGKRQEPTGDPIVRNRQSA